MDTAIAIATSVCSLAVIGGFMYITYSPDPTPGETDTTSSKSDTPSDKGTPSQAPAAADCSKIAAAVAELASKATTIVDASPTSVGKAEVEELLKEYDTFKTANAAILTACKAELAAFEKERADVQGVLDKLNAGATIPVAPMDCKDIPQEIKNVLAEATKLRDADKSTVTKAQVEEWEKTYKACVANNNPFFRACESERMKLISLRDAVRKILPPARAPLDCVRDLPQMVKLLIDGAENGIKPVIKDGKMDVASKPVVDSWLGKCDAELAKPENTTFWADCATVKKQLEDLRTELGSLVFAAP